MKDSFSSIDFTRDTPQKHKRAKAGQVLSQQQTSSVEEKDLDADSDVSATGRPLRNRTTKMVKLVHFCVSETFEDRGLFFLA